MSAICPQGHEVLITYGGWRKRPDCPACLSANLSKKNGLQVVPKTKGSIRTLALDQSTKVSGWSIFDNEQLIQYGAKDFAKVATDRRLVEQKDWLLSMISLWKPDYVAMEDIFFSQNSGTGGLTTYKILAQLQGVALVIMTEANIPYNFLSSSQWREYCHISGKSRTEKKQSALLQVKNWYSIIPSEDEAEAICIGRYGASNYHKKNEIISWG